jgi:hypothetical protein
MVDPIDGPFVEVLGQGLIDLARRVQIFADRLLQYDPAITCQAVGAVEVLADRREKAWWVLMFYL